MSLSLVGHRRIVLLFWTLSVIAIAIWSQVPGYASGWDLQVYKNAIHAMHAGHDPYVDGIAVQREFHSQLALHPNDPPPFTYVYSPITLPVVRLAGAVPQAIGVPLYWFLFFAGAAAAIWAGMQAVAADEAQVFALLAPVAIFFPGMMLNDVLFSGNVAYVFYGLVLAAAVLGWRTGTWGWFYAAVLLASCGKAPMLSLLAIPVLTARRQWPAACATGIAGCFLFALQPVLWPAAFASYLEAVELQFSFNRDFGISAAGISADLLFNVFPYRLTSVAAYLLYAVPALAALLALSRRYFDGRFSLQQWIPVVLVGTILLNPRIMEYDVAPLAVPMALIVWRFAGRGVSAAACIVKMSLFFAIINISTAFPQYLQWRRTEGLVLLAVFAAGVWSLFTAAGVESETVAVAVPEAGLAPLGA